MNYMIIRVKRKREGREGRTSERERRTKRKQGHWGSRLLDHDSSVEVGYGLCYFIVNS